MSSRPRGSRSSSASRSAPAGSPSRSVSASAWPPCSPLLAAGRRPPGCSPSRPASPAHSPAPSSVSSRSPAGPAARAEPPGGARRGRPPADRSARPGLPLRRLRAVRRDELLAGDRRHLPARGDRPPSATRARPLRRGLPRRLPPGHADRRQLRSPAEHVRRIARGQRALARPSPPARRPRPPARLLPAPGPDPRPRHRVRRPVDRVGLLPPLEAFLAARPGPLRVEVPFTREHWEAADLAPRYPIARGWERQLDIAENPLFYVRDLTSAAYRGWLRANAVGYVALPDTQLDYSARPEAALIEAGQNYLHPIARLAHWRVFAVPDAPPLASPPASLTRLGATGFQLRFAGSGTSEVRLHYTAYWVPGGGACATRAPDGFTDVRAPHAGLYTVTARLGLRAMLAGGPSCPAR